VSSPPNICPCFYGIDTATKQELIAANMSIKEIAQKLNVNSLGYLSCDSLNRILKTDNDLYCMGCFSGEYPTQIPDQEGLLNLVFS